MTYIPFEIARANYYQQTFAKITPHACFLNLFHGWYQMPLFEKLRQPEGLAAYIIRRPMSNLVEKLA